MEALAQVENSVQPEEFDIWTPPTWTPCVSPRSECRERAAPAAAAKLLAQALRACRGDVALFRDRIQENDDGESTCVDDGNSLAGRVSDDIDAIAQVPERLKEVIATQDFMIEGLLNRCRQLEAQAALQSERLENTEREKCEAEQRRRQLQAELSELQESKTVHHGKDMRVQLRELYCKLKAELDIIKRTAASAASQRSPGAKDPRCTSGRPALAPRSPHRAPTSPVSPAASKSVGAQQVRPKAPASRVARLPASPQGLPASVASRLVVESGQRSQAVRSFAQDAEHRPRPPKLFEVQERRVREQSPSRTPWSPSSSVRVFSPIRPVLSRADRRPVQSFTPLRRSASFAEHSGGSRLLSAMSLGCAQVKPIHSSPVRVRAVWSPAALASPPQADEGSCSIAAASC